MFAGVAQSVVQLIRNQQVVCSSHITSSKARCPLRDTAPVLFALRQVILLHSYIHLSVSDIRFASFEANKIPLLCLQSNITVACNNITLSPTASH